jgi:hypothetical protein
MAVQQKNKKSHKTDALMRLLVSGSSGAVNPTVSVSFKEDIIRPINDKKNTPKFSAEQEPGILSEPPRKISEQPRMLSEPPRMLSESPRMLSEPPRPAPVDPRFIPPETPRVFPPEMPKTAPPAYSEFTEQIRPVIPAPRINPDKPVELDIVTELTKELLPTAIQRFNVCYCDTCYQAMTEAVAKRSPRIIVMLRSKDDLARAEYLKKQNRNNVLRTVIKEVLEYKTTGRHNNIDKRK